MPKSIAQIISNNGPASTTINDLCQQFWSHQADLESASTNADKRLQKKFRAAIRDELMRRLGDQTDSVLEDYAAGYLYTECKQSASNAADSPPQRIRRPRVMYVEQKTDGDRTLGDRGPAAIGEVSFSKTGRTAYFDGKTFRRTKGYFANYQCVEDGNAYWISGVKKRGTNRHWAGGGAVANLAKPHLGKRPERG